MILTNLLSSLFVMKRHTANQTELRSTLNEGSVMASTSAAPRKRASAYAVIRRCLLGQASSADYRASLSASSTLLRFCTPENVKSDPFRAELRRLSESLSSRRASQERHPSVELTRNLAEKPLEVLHQLASIWPTSQRNRCTPHSNPVRYAILNAIAERSVLASLRVKQQAAAQAYSELNTILAAHKSGRPLPESLTQLAAKVQESEAARSAARELLATAREEMACDSALMTEAVQLLDAPMPYKCRRNFCERKQFLSLLERLSAPDLERMASILTAGTQSAPASALAGAVADEQARRRTAVAEKALNAAKEAFSERFLKEEDCQAAEQVLKLAARAWLQVAKPGEDVERNLTAYMDDVKLRLSMALIGIQ